MSVLRSSRGRTRIEEGLLLPEAEKQPPKTTSSWIACRVRGVVAVEVSEIHASSPFIDDDATGDRECPRSRSQCSPVRELAALRKLNAIETFLGRFHVAASTLKILFVSRLWLVARRP